MAYSPIIITPPSFVDGELKALEALMLAGNSRLHVRKHDATDEELHEFMSGLSSFVDMKRVTVHHNHSLFTSFNCGGFHCRDIKNYNKAEGTLLSTPVHSTFDIKTIKNSDVDYVLLSPVFNSISKQGYVSTFDRDMLTDFLYENRFPFKIIALGGISYQNISETKAMGFDSVALLGSLWGEYHNAADIKQLVKKYKMIDRLWE